MATAIDDNAVDGHSDKPMYQLINIHCTSFRNNFSPFSELCTHEEQIIRYALKYFQFGQSGKNETSYKDVLHWRKVYGWLS